MPRLQVSLHCPPACPRPIKNLATATVARGDVEDTVLATGALQPFQLVSVGAQVSGRVVSLKVRLGDHVSKGEVIATIDPVPATNQLKTAQATLEQMIAQRAAALLRRMDAGQSLPTAVPYPVQAWALGDDLTWILLGGEVVVDYSLRLKRNLGPSRTWVTAYANDVMAYIPSERVLAEGGYEGETSMVPYGLPAKWAPGLEEKIIAAAGRRVRDLEGSRGR